MPKVYETIHQCFEDCSGEPYEYPDEMYSVTGEQNIYRYALILFRTTVNPYAKRLQTHSSMF